MKRPFAFLCAALAIATAASATTFTVNQTGNAFSPTNVNAHPGDTIHFVWSAGFHTVTSGTSCTPDNTFFNSPLDNTHHTFDYTIPAGTSTVINYFCMFHCAAFNMKGTITVTKIGDLNGDGKVDGADLGILLAHWGTSDTASDLDGDGTVGGADLGILLAHWGE